jgi:glycosyltransferase involved in cell wall biosynthesis
MEAAAAALEKLIKAEELRSRMGTAGRARVKRDYCWRDNVQQMIDIYEDMLT